jgi:hypothetical protein
MAIVARKQHISSTRQASIKLRNSGRARRFRAWFINRHPLCCDPLGLHKGLTVATRLNHHIEPAQLRPDLYFVEENNAPLCDTCHPAIEALVKKGKDTKPLFKDYIQQVKDGDG